MRKYIDLMRIDLMIMNGEKNNLRSLMIFVFVFSIAGEIFISPLFGLTGILLIGGMSVPMVFVSHSKYHSEKMFGLLPIERKDLVTARFIMFAALYLAVSAVMYVFMEVSLAVNIYPPDLEKLVAGIGMDFGSICRALFSVCFAIGTVAAVTSIKGYFTDPTAFEALTGVGMTAKKMKPKQLIAFAVIIIAFIAFMLFTSGAVPVTAGLAVVLQLFIQLFTVADGILFSVVMTALAAFSAIYNYVCTILVYEDKDI